MSPVLLSFVLKNSLHLCLAATAVLEVKLEEESTALKQKK